MFEWLKRISDYHDSGYECDHVSPYTKTAGNVDAEIMVVLQDWASHDALKGPFSNDSATLGHTPHLRTNRNLTRLLHKTFGLSLSEVYGTNVFPFVKPGGMSAAIPQRDLVATAKRFTLPEIQIVNPRLVICLGLATFNALRQASELSPVSSLASAIARILLIGV